MQFDELIGRSGIALAKRTTRRSFIGRVGRGVVALAGGAYVAAAMDPRRAEAHHICGHTFTTKSCPHPFAPNTRVDRFGYPIHPDLGYPVDDVGNAYTDPDNQTRRKICEERVPDEYPAVNDPHFGGGWSRCCNGRIRHISDCCSTHDIRINGDAAVRGYCQRGRKVFCIAFRDLKVRC